MVRVPAGFFPRQSGLNRILQGPHNLSKKSLVQQPTLLALAVELGHADSP